MTTMAISNRDIELPEVTIDRNLPVSLPPDTIVEGVRRLGWLALAYAIGNITGPFARLVLSVVDGTIQRSSISVR